MPNNESISRSEFESHRRQVSEDIAGLADAIKEEGHQRSKDTQTLREDIKELAQGQGRPQWQALSFAFGIFSFVCLALASIYIWGQEARWTSGEKRVSELIEAEARFQEATSKGRHEIQEEEMREVRRRITQLEQMLFLPMGRSGELK